MEFKLKTFGALTVDELFRIYALRCNVFVVEQNCAYQDPDEIDRSAFHVMVFDDNKALLGYTRIVPPGIIYPEPAIGRVVVEKKTRGTGLGEMLMKFSINKTIELFQDQDILISAQAYLIGFYSRLGFITEGAGYDEDNIPHIKMRYNLVH